MRRLALLLATTAAMTLSLLTAAGPASADPLEAVDVFTTDDGAICVTYNDLSTVCTSPVLP